MSELAKVEEGRVLSLADYEARIYLYREQIGTGYIGIGRTLNEVKEAGVVPHGQWETWVTETTGLSVRQAQRCMQAATEIRDGSAMARLEMSKALLLLSSGLEDDEKERIAEKAADEGASVRQLKEELRQAKLKVVQESGLAAEIKSKLKEAESKRANLEAQLKATMEAYRKEMDNASTKAYQEGYRNCEHEIREEIKAEYEGKIAFINSERESLENTRQNLLARVNEEVAKCSAQWDNGYKAGTERYEEQLEKANAQLASLADELKEARKSGMSPENVEEAIQDAVNAAKIESYQKYLAELREVQEDLAAAEAREAEKSKRLEELKREKRSAEMAGVRGVISANAMSGMDLTAAVREFIGRAGVLPQMGVMLAGMDAEDRNVIMLQVETVARWVEGARAALNTVAGSGDVM